MGKLIAILGVCLVAAGGGAYGLYAHTDLFADAQAPAAAGGCCCGASAGLKATACGESETPAMALAGPLAAVGADLARQPAGD